jgi:hypothetical protein
MRFSTISSGLAAIAAISALAACAGHGLVPSQGAASDFVSSTNAMVPESKATQTPPCYTAKYQPEWVFQGSCVIGTLSKKGTAINLPAYKGVALDISIPKNDLKGATQFTFANAVDNKDIVAYKVKGKSKAFPSYNKNQGVIIYAEGVNLSKSQVSMSGNLILTATLAKGMKYPGKNCALYYLNKEQQWMGTPVSNKPNLQKLTLTINSFIIDQSGGFPAYPAAIFFAIYCNNQ